MYDIVLFRPKSNEDALREACRQLRWAGFAEREISQLLHLRKRYATQQAGWEDVMIFRRLEFVRWLVKTGRLTEQTVREGEQAPTPQE